jgi:ribosomal protein S18 acetylase RimI-like enzyme
MNAIQTPNYKISVMSQDELSTAINWARDEGWNPGIHDAAAFYQADPTGFLAGKHNDQIIATISAVKYGSDFGFIGLYIVKDAFRDKGFGFKLWEAAISSLSGRNIGLDGVLAQQDNYKKSGFKLAHRNIRFAGKSTKSTLTPRAISSEHIEFKDIAAYDSQYFPDERSAFLKSWIAPENSQTLAIVEDSRILGYGSIRACDRGFKIGPLNAETSDIAAELFSALTATVPEASEIFLDVPEPNKAAIALAQKFGMTPVFETARMYTKSFPNLPLEKIFGITTFELG